MRKAPPRSDEGSEHANLDVKALERALRLLGTRPRATAEVRERLRRWGYSDDVADGVLEYLEERGYVNDEEFARAYVEEMVRKGFGPKRVRQKLKEKRLDRSMIERAMDVYPYDDEGDMAFEAARAKVKEVPPAANTGEVAKLVGYLLRRGFSRGVAEGACRRLLSVDTQNWRE